MTQKFLATEFEALRQAAFPDADETRLRVMRWCFFAGAHSIVNKLPQYLDGGDETTGRDMCVMESIAEELNELQSEIASACPTAGSA